MHVPTKDELRLERFHEHAGIRIADTIVAQAAPLALEFSLVRRIDDIRRPFVQKQYIDPLEFESAFDVLLIKKSKYLVAHGPQARDRRSQVLKRILLIDTRQTRDT